VDFLNQQLTANEKDLHAARQAVDAERKISQEATRGAKQKDEELAACSRALGVVRVDANRLATEVDFLSQRMTANENELHAARQAVDAERKISQEATRGAKQKDEELAACSRALGVARADANRLATEVDFLNQRMTANENELHAARRAVDAERKNTKEALFQEQKKVKSLLHDLEVQNERKQNYFNELTTSQIAVETLGQRCLKLEKLRLDQVLNLFGPRLPATKAELDRISQLITQSLLFDHNWYRQQAKISADVDPVLHYLREGAALGLDAHPLFSTSYYLQENLDVVRCGQNPLVHYLLEGHKELRDPHPYFSTRFYLDTNLDVAEIGMNPLVHFFRYGGEEKRNPHPMFDVEWYVQTYPDVATSGLNPLVHFVLVGEAQGNDPGPFFQSRWYAKYYSDVSASNLSPLTHYLLYGQREGRRPSPNFDPASYCEAYSDVATSGMPALEHYILYGKAEGRLPAPCKQ
jgi:hypothetical protein